MPQKKPTPEKAREYNARYKAKKGEQFLIARRAMAKAWISRNKVQYAFAKAVYRFRLKMEALQTYSGPEMKCARCGYDADLDALCLDHINDDGAAHRAELNISSRNGKAGTTIHERIKAMGYIEGLQVLCANCNMIKELRRKRGGKTAAEMAEAAASQVPWGPVRKPIAKRPV